MACSYLIINVSSNDLTSAFGNTNPSQNGKVYLTYPVSIPSISVSVVYVDFTNPPEI